MASDIEIAVSNDDWATTRQLIETKLVDDPENNWIMTRLSLTYYEQFEYERALELSIKAYNIMPDCPLVLWDYAGSLAMNNRIKEAIAIYGRIIDRGIHSLAYDECGEGLAWARGVYVDPSPIL